MFLFVLEFHHSNKIDERLVNYIYIYIYIRINQVGRHYLFVKNISTTIDIVFLAYIGINRSLFTNEQMHEYILLPCRWLFSLFKYISYWYMFVYMYIYCLRDKTSDHIE